MGSTFIIRIVDYKDVKWEKKDNLESRMNKQNEIQYITLEPKINQPIKSCGSKKGDKSKKPDLETYTISYKGDNNDAMFDNLEEKFGRERVDITFGPTEVQKFHEKMDKSVKVTKMKV